MQWNWDSGPYPRGVDDMILGVKIMRCLTEIVFCEHGMAELFEYRVDIDLALMPGMPSQNLGSSEQVE